MRKNFYSHVHRFMRQFLADFGTTIAKTDFSNSEKTAHLKTQFCDFKKLLDRHAQHEDNVCHPLIQEKEPHLFQQIETEHKTLDEKLKQLGDQLDIALEKNIAEEEQHLRGEKFYLAYTAYLIEYFAHLLQEELVLMPALQAHYSDDQLRAVTFNTYNQMSSEQIIDMLKGLYPHINRYQKQVFLDDIRMGYPEKFANVFPAILKEITDPTERALLDERYSNALNNG